MKQQIIKNDNHLGTVMIDSVFTTYRDIVINVNISPNTPPPKKPTEGYLSGVKMPTALKVFESRLPTPT